MNGDMIVILNWMKELKRTYRTNIEAVEVLTEHLTLPALV